MLLAAGPGGGCMYVMVKLVLCLIWGFISDASLQGVWRPTSTAAATLWSDVKKEIVLVAFQVDVARV